MKQGSLETSLCKTRASTGRATADFINVDIKWPKKGRSPANLTSNLLATKTANLNEHHAALAISGWLTATPSPIALTVI